MLSEANDGENILGDAEDELSRVVERRIVSKEAYKRT